MRRKRTMGNETGWKKGNGEVNNYQNISRTSQLSQIITEVITCKIYDVSQQTMNVFSVT